MVEIQNAASFELEVGIPREDPAAVVQERMASRCSQRYTVDLPAVAEVPLVRVVRTRSSRLQRDGGWPW